LKKDDNQALAVRSLNEAATHRGADQPVVLPEEKATDELKVPQAKPPSPKPEGEVTVAPNLSDLVTGKLETPAAAEAARRGHELNAVIHRVLIVGLAISTALILAGLTLDLVRHRQVPTDAPTFAEVFRRVAQFRASGFLMLGLLVLIATPILRVIGSTLAFLYERDWRYALITFVVLLVVTLSLLLGRG
jgi:uncharacterized membrane protein